MKKLDEHRERIFARYMPVQAGAFSLKKFCSLEDTELELELQTLLILCSSQNHSLQLSTARTKKKYIRSSIKFENTILSTLIRYVFLLLLVPWREASHEHTVWNREVLELHGQFLTPISLLQPALTFSP